METRSTIKPRLVRLGRRSAAPAALGCIIALGSLAGAHAAGQITSRQIKDGTVAGRDVRNGSLRASKLALGTLRPRDFTGDPTGPVGPDGDPGPAGTVLGPAGFRGVGYVVGDPADVTVFATVVAPCPSGTKAIGGGTSVSDVETVGTATSAPTAGGAAWLSTVYQWEPGKSSQVFPWALCAAVD
jgi:hypothetical protein